jgi:hypothetical protein
LAEVGRHPHLIFDAVASWTSDNLEKRQLSCHETATHYKWFLHYHKRLHFKVWLHQYKLAADRKLGHAEVPHNHRYSLASIILSGGFTHHYFQRTEGGLLELAEERCDYQAGDVYEVAWQKVHKLSELRDGTITLVIETPAVRHFSEAYYSVNDQPQRFFDFVGLHERLAEQVGSLAGVRRVLFDQDLDTSGEPRDA